MEEGASGSHVAGRALALRLPSYFRALPFTYWPSLPFAVGRFSGVDGVKKFTVGRAGNLKQVEEQVRTRARVEIETQTNTATEQREGKWVMVGVYEGVVLGSNEFKRKDGSLVRRLVVAIGNETYEVPGNGIPRFTKVFVFGDARRYEGRGWFTDSALVVPAGETDLLSFIEGLK